MAIIFIEEYVVAADSSTHEVINRTRILGSKSAISVGKIHAEFFAAKVC